MLAERLKKVIHKLVDSQQMTFIKRSHIIDAILIANECVEGSQRSNLLGILCKLDIQKAFHHLNWIFLSFYRKWVLVLGGGGESSNISIDCTVKFLVLINESPTGFFSYHRGLRQGEPLISFPIHPSYGRHEQYDTNC